MGIFGRTSITTLRRRASAERRGFEASVRANDVTGALRHSEREEQAISQLVTREPGEPFHKFVLAGVFYNRATVLDAIGQGAEAVAAARKAVDHYEAYDPALGAPDAVERQLRTMRGQSDSVETLIAHAADARARLARLLAKYEGRSRADAVHHHGKAAIETYEALLRFGNETTRSDVDRIRVQYDEAKRHLR